jgi:nucleoside-diphosphate-sugar epimerase
MLVANGHEVWGLRRQVARLPEDVNPVRGDLRTLSAGDPLPRKLDWIYYTAAAPERTEQAYRESYLEGLVNLVKALRERGERPRRLFFTSSTGVYGQNRGEWVDEHSPTEPTRFTGKVMLEAETFLRSTGFASTSVRFGGIYGPGRGMLLRQARDSQSVVSKPIHYTNRIHRDDCAATLLHLMSVPEPLPIYVAVDDHPAPRHEVLSWLVKEMGRPELELLEEEGQARTGKRCSNRLLKETGFRFRYPTYKEGYRDLVDSVKSAPPINGASDD